MVTRPDARAGRGRALAPVAGQAGRRRARHRGADPAAAARPRRSSTRLRELAPDCLPGRRLRRARAARRARRPAPRLGQPALLAAARLARRRAGAARGDGRRRGHRRHDLPARGGARHRPGVRHDDRDGPPRRHRRRPARPARRRRRRAARRDARRARGRLAARRAAAGRRRQPRARSSPSTTPGSLGRAGVRRRPAVRGCTPAPGAWTTFRGERVKVGPVASRRGLRRARRTDRGRRAAPRRAAVDASAPSTSAPAIRTPVELRRGPARTARSRWPPPTGPAASGSQPASASMAEHGHDAARRRGASRRRPVGADPRRPQRRARPSERTRARRADPARGLHGAARGRRRRLRQPRAARVLRRAPPHGRDAAFATELAYGTCGWQGFYDAVIAGAAGATDRADRPAGARRAAPRAPTSCSACGSPTTPPSTRPWAWPARSRGAGAAGFVNAVMRRISERDLEAWLDGRGARRAAEPSARSRCGTRHPEWVVRALRAALLGHGRATADDGRRRAATPCSRPTTTPPRVHPRRPARARHGRRARSTTAPRRRRSRRSRVGPRRRRPGRDPGRARRARRRAGRGPPAGRPRPRRRRRSAPTARALARPVRRPGRQGRAARRAGRSSAAPTSPRSRSARTGPTWSAARSRRVRRAERPGRRSRCAPPTAGRSARTSPRRYDRVLVDAPCTGLGALRRRPEARWRRQPSDLAELAPLQRDAARLALDAVAPGGVVAYATCSPHLAETRFVVARRAQAARTTSSSSTPATLFADASASRSTARGRADRPALAARPRHRRDVPRPAAQAGLTEPSGWLRPAPCSPCGARC